ncbi:unnamed protein product [Periconia digitata]|uniref:Uncharacterized protein n=1 Tax=Periconia digitata TaxID=1303443 RepID=A0A9W4XWU5_9PLEO|nr:unnamed protein product [Periconia digitata]
MCAYLSPQTGRWRRTRLKRNKTRSKLVAHPSTSTHRQFPIMLESPTKAQSRLFCGMFSAPSTHLQHLRKSMLPFLLLVPRIFAQSSGCTGTFSTFERDGYTISFRNLCGKDISAPVDFPNPYFASTWSTCLELCVNKQPLCYGFDYGVPVDSALANCWLMQSEFPESSAIENTNSVNAAMLTPDMLARLPADCTSLGLAQCFREMKSTSSSTTPSSSSTLSTSVGTPMTVTTTVASTGTTNTSPAPPPPVSPKSGLSTGAKAGIGGGIGGAAVLGIIAAGGIFGLRRRRKRAIVPETAHTGGAAADANAAEEKIVDEDAKWRYRSELPANEGLHQHRSVELDGRGISNGTH